MVYQTKQLSRLIPKVAWKCFEKLKFPTKIIFSAQKYILKFCKERNPTNVGRKFVLRVWQGYGNFLSVFTKSCTQRLLAITFIKSLVGNVTWATSSSSSLFWATGTFFSLFEKISYFLSGQKFILGIWGMNSWQILALVSFIQLIKFRYHFKTEKHRYFAVPNSLEFWSSSADPYRILPPPTNLRFPAGIPTCAVVWAGAQRQKIFTIFRVPGCNSNLRCCLRV